MSKSKKLPNGYWLKEGEASANLVLVWRLFKAHFPNFLERREKVTDRMVKIVTEEFIFITGDRNVTKGKIEQQLRPSFSCFTAADAIKDSTYYSKYDKAMISMKNRLV